MHLSDLNGKTVCMLGYGREGRAVVSLLESCAPECEITIADQNSDVQIENDVHWKQLGEGWLENLEKFDVIIKSPGIPPNEKLDPIHEKMTNATQLFLDSINQDATVIGITGSKGKSTTASLIYSMLKEDGKDAILLGNIGDTAILHIDEIKAESIVIMEMSSYQLQEVSRSPQVAIITALFPEHLDYHGSIEKYIAAKKNICNYQSADDVVFFHAEGNAKDIADVSKGKKMPYTENDSPVSLSDTKLIGNHNLVNIAGATSVARHFGIEEDVIVRAIKAFEGLPHRLKSVGEYKGIMWIDDAISTTPESTIAAIASLPNVSTVILGGKDRGLDFTELGTEIENSNIQHVILHGESGKRIAKSITSAKIHIHEAQTMEDVVKIACEHTEKNAAVLLSPASPSYDQYKSFEEKGNIFTSTVKKQLA